MERSQSYTHFELSEDDNNNNNVINSKLSTITLCKTKNVRRTRKLQKQQQIQQAISGSSDNIDAVTISNTLQLKRKRQLQRQKTAELDDDMVYAAEEEYEDDEYEVDEICENGSDFESTLTHISPKNITTNERVKRQLPYQKSHLSQDDSLSTTLTTDSPSSPPTSPTNNKSHQFKHADSFDSNSTAADMSPISRRHNFVFLPRDNSIHSDSSHYSSVDSLLEARKPDPEAILINLGFGPVGSEDILSRIPKRFLKPSQVRGIDTDAFVKRLQLASNLADHSVLGYRGLTGNPDIPPSTIVAKIMQRFEVNERKRSMGSIEHAI